jgi:cytidyltransferase-like protein
MTPSVIEDFNKLVDKISGISQREEGGEFKTFEDYLKLKTVNESIVDAIEVIQEEQVLNYRQFMNLGRISLPGPIVEALTVPHKEQGKQKVNMIVGRFQPFTLGHAKVFEQIHKQNGLPVVVFTVRGKKPDPDKSPFSEELQQAMFAKMQREYPFLEAMYVAPSAAVDTLYSMLRPAYEPVLWGYGTDRKKQYDFMINKPEYREQLGVDPSFSGYEIKRADEDVSASQVREAIMLDDKKTFERMTPRSIHDMWETLQDVLVPVSENRDSNLSQSNDNLEILENTFNIELTQGKPRGELLGVIDSTSTTFASKINSLKISLAAESIDAVIDSKCERGNINEPLLKETMRSILRPGWVGGDNYDEFTNLNVVELAKTDHNKYDLNQIIKYYSNFFNAQSLNNLLNKSDKIGGISVGKGEYFLAMLTDYTRPPKGNSGDLWFNGSVEVKDNDARLGGTDTKRDGTQSAKQFCETIGLSYNRDSFLIDGLKNQIIPFIRENEDTLFGDTSLMKSAINSMSNYDITVTDKMISIFRTAYKTPSEFESYLGALHLYSYNVTHDHKQIVFIDTVKMILSSFTPTSEFTDSWNFAQSNLKFSSSSWHGRHAQNKPGISVNLK